jgi:hypothetical protein
MSISEKTYKVIWGQAAGRCSICRKETILPIAGAKKSLVGEAAHIVGETLKAARGKEALPMSQRNKPDNLLLLRREHHKIVDDDETTYTVERLHEIKQSHIKWIAGQLNKLEPWKSNLAQLVYINVPRLNEQAAVQGYHVDLSRYRDTQSLNSLGWELNHVMSAFQAVLPRLTLDAVPIEKLKVHEAYIGSLVSFDRVRFRTKNSSRLGHQFSGDLSKDPHIYATLGDFRLVIFIDENWITTNTAMGLFRSGQTTFSGIARITNVGYEDRYLTATGLVIGLPKSWLDAANEQSGQLHGEPNGDQRGGTKATSHFITSLEAQIDEAEARKRDVHFTPPPEFCDLCRKTLEGQRYMIDGPVDGKHGPWGCMCISCFAEQGGKIGWGYGQLYRRDRRGWLGVAGFPPPGSEDE